MRICSDFEWDSSTKMGDLDNYGVDKRLRAENWSSEEIARLTKARE